MSKQNITILLIIVSVLTIIFFAGDPNYKFRFFPNTFYDYKKLAITETIKTFKNTDVKYVNFDPDHNEMRVVFNDGYKIDVFCNSPFEITYANLFFALNDKNELLYSKSGVGGEEYNINKDVFFKKMEHRVNWCINNAYKEKIKKKYSNKTWEK